MGFIGSFLRGRNDILNEGKNNLDNLINPYSTEPG